jgi:hypothetical protein
LLKRRTKLPTLKFKDLDKLEQTEEPIYSNFDHKLETATAAKLKENPGKLYAPHYAYNFCGYIWFDKGRFWEQVWVYHTVRRELSNPNLEELIEEVNSEFGNY